MIKLQVTMGYKRMGVILGINAERTMTFEIDYAQFLEWVEKPGNDRETCIGVLCLDRAPNGSVITHRECKVIGWK